MSSAEVFFYLTTIGWKSGNPHEIEIWFVTHDGCHYMIAEHRERAHWLQNVRHQPNIMFRIGRVGDWLPGTAHPIPDDDPLAQTIKTLFREKYDWDDGLVVQVCAE